MKTDWMRKQVMESSRSVLENRGPLSIRELVREIRYNKPEGTSKHVLYVVSVSSLSAMLHSYGHVLEPKITHLKLRDGTRLWYLDGDCRIYGYYEQAYGSCKKPKRNAAQPIIDAIDAMLHWYEKPEEIFDD